MFELVLLNLITVLGGFVVGLSGFGLVLVCVPLYALLIDVKIAIAMAGLLGWLSSIPLAWKMHQHVQKQATAWLFIGAIPGSFVGAEVLSSVPSHYIMIAMALVIISGSVYCLQFRGGEKKSSGPGISLTTGLASGMLGASVGEGGPPIVSFSVIQPWTAEQAKATMLAFFVLQMAVAIASFVYTGLLTVDIIQQAAVVAPGLIAGVLLGLASFSTMQRKHINFQRIMHYALILIGLYLLVKAVFFD